MPKLIRITTVPIALKYLLAGQMRYMKENGFDVIMISADGVGRGDLESQEGCRHQIIPMTRKVTPLADLRSLWRLYKFFKKEKPDIVHSHTPKAGLLSMLAARWAGVKVRVHTIAGLRFMTSRGVMRRVLIAMEKLTARSATHVWANSFSLMKYISEHNLASSKKLEVIGKGSSNGINLDRFSPGALQQDKLEKIKEMVHFDEKLTYFLCIGRIVRDKGIEELLNAFTRIYENNNQVRLMLVGSFEDELDPVSDEVRKVLKAHPAIILPGWMDDVEYFMHFSFALVHPSHREGFPNVLLQAGATLCPVVCSRIAGNVDVIEHEKTGLLFEVKNEEELYRQLERTLADPKILKQYAINLRQKIEQSFNQPVLHARILSRYRELLGTVDNLKS